MALPLADLEGKYEILAKLREGGMGAIYQVRHRLLDEVRVVKVLKAHHGDDEELRERFAREARSAIQLRHPNVVQIYDFSVDDSGAGLIVMEFIRGTDLSRLIEKKRLPSLPLALEIARQSLRSLGFLHRLGFVHRDVSPDNLMLTEDVEGQPLVKLIDLGIAKSLGAEQTLTVSGSFLGKFRYASPEHFGAEGPDGTEARSDLYTFGLVFYELLTGVYPMPGESTSQLIASHLFQPPAAFERSDPEGRIPEPVRAMVLRALRKKVDERFADAREWIEAIQELQKEWPLGKSSLDEARLLASEQESRVGAASDSTQGRFDRHFGLDTTPRPGPVAAPAPTSAAADGAAASHADGGAAVVAPSNPLDVLLAGAEALFQLGQPQQARQQVSTILGMEPGHAGALDLRDRLDGAVDPDPESAAGPTAVGDEGVSIAPESTTLALDSSAELRSEAPAALGGVSTAVVREIEELMGAGELVKADRRWHEAAQDHGKGGALAAIRQRLDDLFHGQVLVKVQELLEEADRLVDQDAYPQALDRVRQAQDLAPKSGELHEVLTQGVQGLQQKIEGREVRLAVGQIEQKILLLLRERRLEEAHSELLRAESNYGHHEILHSLGQILERAVQERQNELVAEAGQALEEGAFGAAIESLEEVRRLDPSNPWVQKQLDRARKKLEQQRLEKEAAEREAQERRAELLAVRQQLKAHQLDAASAAIESASERWGEMAVAELRQALAGARHEQARHLLDQAEKAREAADLFKARLLVAEASDLDPEDTAIGRFAELLDETVDEHVAGDPVPLGSGSGLLHTIAEIERLRVEGQPLGAWKAVQQAIVHFGENAALIELRQHLAEQILEESGDHG